MTDAPHEPEQLPWKQPAEDVTAALDADVLVFNGEIARWWDKALIDACRDRRRRPNVFLILVTSGGDADAGYRMARCLQRYYTRVIMFVSGYCKSAGTLIAFGAHELVVADHGELGPLDVQMRKADELWETSSGLTVMEAISMLEETAHKMLEDGFLRIKAGSQGQITFKTASEIAGGIVSGALEPIYRQIDPMHVGEAGRAMKDRPRLRRAPKRVRGEPQDRQPHSTGERVLVARVCSRPRRDRPALRARSRTA